MISEETRAAIAERIGLFPQARGALLPALHLVQKEHGHVSRECAEELAEIFEIRAIEVQEVITFYNMFYSTPQPRNHVYVCTNLPCSLRGGRQLLKRIESHLGIKAGQATPDGRVGLGHEECLGACGYAPMMRVGSKYYEDLDVETALRVIDELE